jgi:hypothetical protein
MFLVTTIDFDVVFQGLTSDDPVFNVWSPQSYREIRIYAITLILHGRTTLSPRVMLCSSAKLLLPSHHFKVRFQLPLFSVGEFHCDLERSQ